ncbi:hypothetical protein [Streptomyces sp. SID13031]|uniref:hypothetical protein n=1 Tax=Streptomyces sp. SID13031 TaxID=2706046 RepID=UPI0013C71853|nr:hypothetical protein [Streptomyces sp. SID13031]NEA37548.1 hypothetical protein [Streptomyces sp. SID13031]
MIGKLDRATRSSIWVDLLLPGFHRWPAAPPNRDHLAYRHRHHFLIRAEVMVEHHDRDVEFMSLTEDVTHWWGAGDRELGEASCENVAEQIGTDLRGLGYSAISVSVAVDHEGGAKVEWVTK